MEIGCIGATYRNTKRVDTGKQNLEFRMVHRLLGGYSSDDRLKATG